MSNIKTTIVGEINISKKIKNISAKGKQLIQHAVFKSVADVEKHAKKSISQGSPSGRIYQRYKPKRTHQASAPGQPPATDTGFLVNNIKRKMDSDNMGGEIASRSTYSKFLEFGTSKMLPRPYMFPAMEKNKKKIKDRIKKAMQSATKSSTK
tara:strand:+ start:168 stop:623 length:456 start_codon:yes stop_codon:yes gene_type:complete